MEPPTFPRGSFFTDEHRGQHRCEAAFDEAVEREPVERELEQRDVADSVGEPRSGDLCRPFEIDPAVDRREVEVVARRKVEGRRVAPAADLLGVVFRLAVGHVVLGRIRDAVEHLPATAFGCHQRLFQGLQLVFDPLQLGELLGTWLSLHLARGAQLLHSRLDLSHGAVGLEQLVEELGRALAGKRRTKAVGVLAGRAEVDHARESRYASSTWATPSSSTEGHTKSASSLTRSCAFATATP